jgi:hypothetical protein
LRLLLQHRQPFAALPRWRDEHDRRHFRGVAESRPPATYLDLAAELRPLLEKIDGFISIERFESLTEPGKILVVGVSR